MLIISLIGCSLHGYSSATKPFIGVQRLCDVVALISENDVCVPYVVIWKVLCEGVEMCERRAQVLLTVNKSHSKFI